MTDEYKTLASRMVEGLKEDPNIRAVLVYGSVAMGTVSEGSDIDLLLIVEDIPEDVDIFGVKRTSIEGVPVDLAYKTNEYVEFQIDYEAGCWYASSIMLNSEILYDPDGIAESFRKKILEMPDERKQFVLDCLMEDARTYDYKIRQCIELGDLRGAVYLMRLVCESFVQMMFILNNTRPSSEKGMIRDFLALESVPEGFLALYDFLEGFDEIDDERVSAMVDAHRGLIREVERHWKPKK
ncbi:MAG: nucleotidyltransferase domain-containing protein [Methanobacteriota archaeon]|nr:MAG: nucleotidyltransferase domain-containing protein [Euryarchaeota archaeon]